MVNALKKALRNEMAQGLKEEIGLNLRQRNRNPAVTLETLKQKLNYIDSCMAHTKKALDAALKNHSAVETYLTDLHAMIDSGSEADLSMIDEAVDSYLAKAL